MTFDDFQKSCAALCAWREARGEGRDGIRCVVHVIDNRAKLWKRTWAEIVFQFEQFSSMSAPSDPELCLVPKPPDQAFDVCMQVVEDVFQGKDFDLTKGATHYFNPSVVLPEWAKKMVKLTSIGHHDFYKNA